MFLSLISPLHHSTSHLSLDRRAVTRRQEPEMGSYSSPSIQHLENDAVTRLSVTTLDRQTVTSLSFYTKIKTRPVWRELVVNILKSGNSIA
ncbi:hypothetical protein M404DRAFT_774424 [Pisolithus tinctorius Marx 270]|uniref:Uncharacterized protein n=1 Tax=Pisolithus tinctorius Marx 270 TaxID=870435 RepID=A0A0C3JQY1_PISTI|nr:hypothetical protein M404DRAFT_774424 [Pisolithus tinctorius Marx 270]